MRYNGGGLRRGWMLLLRKAHTSCHLVSAVIVLLQGWCSELHYSSTSLRRATSTAS